MPAFGNFLPIVSKNFLNRYKFFSPAALGPIPTEVKQRWLVTSQSYLLFCRSYFGMGEQ